MSEWKHPELREGEVYIGNVENNGIGFFDDRGNQSRYWFPSERLGKVAYYADGPERNQPIPSISGFRPWFALATEFYASELGQRRLATTPTAPV